MMGNLLGFCKPRWTRYNMAMEFQSEDLDKVCRLANLDCDPENRDQIQSQLQGILSHVQRLTRLDLDGVEPYSLHAQSPMELREDTPQKSDISITDNAPKHDQNCFEVPQIIAS